MWGKKTYLFHLFLGSFCGAFPPSSEARSRQPDASAGKSLTHLWRGCFILTALTGCRAPGGVLIGLHFPVGSVKLQAGLTRTWTQRPTCCSLFSQPLTPPKKLKLTLTRRGFGGNHIFCSEEKVRRISAWHVYNRAELETCLFIIRYINKSEPIKEKKNWLYLNPIWRKRCIIIIIIPSHDGETKTTVKPAGCDPVTVFMKRTQDLRVVEVPFILLV